MQNTFLQGAKAALKTEKNQLHGMISKKWEERRTGFATAQFHILLPRAPTYTQDSAAFVGGAAGDQ